VGAPPCVGRGSPVGQVRCALGSILARLTGVRQRKNRILISGPAKALDVLARLLPGSYGAILAAGARRWGLAPDSPPRPPAVHGDGGRQPTS